MSFIGKEVIHKNFQSESFYFFWFPGAPIVGILVSKNQWEGTRRTFLKRK